MSAETKQVRVTLDVELHARGKVRMAELRTGWDRYVADLIEADLTVHTLPILGAVGPAFDRELAEERELREQERQE